MVALIDHHEIQGKTGFFTLYSESFECYIDYANNCGPNGTS